MKNDISFSNVIFTRIIDTYWRIIYCYLCESFQIEFRKPFPLRETREFLR